MANFPTHVTSSAILGAAYGTAAHIAYGIPLPSCLLSGGLCTIAGVLPDVDSDNAVILREILAFVAAVIPMLLLDRFRAMMWTQESIVVAAGLIYVFIRFGIGELIRRVTVHRGMWHSIPAALTVSGVVYYLCACPDTNIRLYKTGAVLIGFLWHLVLDEIYAVDSGRGRIRVKKSFGTAFKLFGANPIANLLVYGQLAGIVFVLYSPDRFSLQHLEYASYQHGPAQAEPIDPGYIQQPPTGQMTPIPPLPSPAPAYPRSVVAPYGPPITTPYYLPGGSPQVPPSGHPQR